MATATIAPVRPALDVENQARRRCRSNLIGLRVRHYSGETWTIGATDWRIGTVLIVSPNKMTGPWFEAAELTLLDPWPFACCRGKLGTNGLPKRRKGVQ